jgi:hypothetical protein
MATLRALLWVVTGLAGFVIWQRPSLDELNRMVLLAELQPVVLKNCTLTRFGSAHDGGYLVCDNLGLGVQSAYSYGVGPNDDFGCNVSRRYQVPVHQYDCFDPARPSCEGGKTVFHDECVGPRAERIEGRFFDTLENQIARNGDWGKRLLVKMDVEGAEWDSLFSTPPAVLDPIDQLVIEMHGVDAWRFVEVVRRLERHFHLVNVHFNNWTCTPEAAPLPAPVFEALWVHKRLGVRDEWAPTPAPMSRLNAPNNPRMPDCQLGQRR